MDYLVDSLVDWHETEDAIVFFPFVTYKVKQLLVQEKKMWG